MGNQSSALGDEPNAAIAQKNLQHFDHSFKAELHTATGYYSLEIFGECKAASRSVTVICKGNSLEVIEDVGISSRRQAEFFYAQISAISWDHANSQVKLTVNRPADDNVIILVLSNSIEFEGELKLRLNGLASTNRQVKVPTPTYIGMFAGATKPKPFQRKRPNLSKLPAGKLPSLHDMRNMALELNRGSYKPCTQGESRRLEIALQHIYEGCNTFSVTAVRGMAAIANQFRGDSVLEINDEALVFRPRGRQGGAQVDFAFEDIASWAAVDNDSQRLGDSGIEITSSSGDAVYFGVTFVRDVKHTLEYFWNKYQVANGGQVKLASTHGRPIVEVHTLSGDTAPPEPPLGQTEVADQDGILVRPGGKLVPRRASIGAGVMTSKEPKVVPPENREVKKHWHKVVLHQGWLLKQGGVGVGNAKSWIKRYFVLYKTSQGHFLVYYSDFTECPMYTTEKNHRNVVDMAKATFIRPGSRKSEAGDIPPHSFDIVTTEREWTLCAESQENVAKWLKLITRAVDEDVAILPDEELVFKVKPKVDPLNVLPSTDYTTSLKVSANGISVTTPDANGGERNHYFWVYTDFYKWSLLQQNGKLALLVNVFADASFSRRIEYIFRTKEAQRLATAIEFFIEKFMSVMHIRLEANAGVFEEAAQEARAAAQGQAAAGPRGGLHEVQPDDEARDDEVAYPEELDLLGLEIDPSGSPVPSVASAPAHAHSGGHGNNNGGADLFGDDPFGDSFGSSAPSSAAHAAAHTHAPAHAPAAAAVDLFGDDPFGGDPFGAPAAPASASGAAARTAPPLTPQQLQRHRGWLQAAVAASGGPLYDDGSLQVGCKIELRGSQCRLTLNYHNQSTGALADFQASIADPAGLMRFEAAAAPSSLAGLASAAQVVMLECVKPVFPGPELKLTFVDTLHGRRSSSVALPLLVTSFNEPLSLGADDFLSRWTQLVAQGQEAQDIIKPSFQISSSVIQQALGSVLKFGLVKGLPDSTEFVMYGAASLRTGALTPTGEKINVGSLVKLELNVQSNAIRVTLRTLHPAATSAILQTVKSLFA